MVFSVRHWFRRREGSPTGRINSAREVYVAGALYRMRAPRAKGRTGGMGPAPTTRALVTHGP